MNKERRISNDEQIFTFAEIYATVQVCDATKA